MQRLFRKISKDNYISYDIMGLGPKIRENYSRKIRHLYLPLVNTYISHPLS